MAKSHSMLRWMSSQIEVYYWAYASVPAGMTYAEYLDGKQPNIYAFSNSKASNDNAESTDNSESTDTTPATNMLAELKAFAKKTKLEQHKL